MNILVLLYFGPLFFFLLKPALRTKSVAPLCICAGWGVVHCQPACLPRACHCSGSQHHANPRLCTRACVCASVHVALRGLCWFCCAVSVTYWAGLVGVPWLRCAVFTPSIYSPKHSQPYYTSHSLPLFLFLFFFLFSIYFPDFKPVAVFRWPVCRQPGIIFSLQGAGLSFISQPLNQKQPIFLLPKSLLI